MRLARAAALLLILLPACQSLVREDNPNNEANTLEKVGTVEFHLTEEAYDDDYFVPRSRSFTVDPFSTLVMRFAIAEGGEAPVAPEWRMINDWLAAFDNLVAKRTALDAEAVDLTDPNAVADFQERVSSFDVETIDATVAKGEDLMAASVPDAAERKAIIDKGDDSELVTISRWMRERLRVIRQEGSRHRTSNELAVRVLCYRSQPSGEKDQIHVENYDSIASASEHLPDRWALGLDEAELATLKMEIAQSEQAVAFMRGFQGRAKELGRLQDALIEEIRGLFARIKDTPLKSAKDVQAAIVKGLEVLKKLPDSAKPETAIGMLTAHVETLATVGALAERASAIEKRFSGLRDTADAASLMEFLMGDAGLVTSIGSLKTEAEAWVKDAGKVAEAATYVATNAPTALSGQPATAWKNALSDEQRGKVDAYLAALEPFRVLLGALTSRFGKKDSVTEVLRDLRNPESPIDRDLGDLLDGRINLAGHAEPGDSIIVRVELIKKDTKEAVESAEYHLRVRRQGWYGDLSGQAIFARGASGVGDATSWKPNVAALISWSHQERFPTGFGKMLNWLNPSPGLHAASLDQGTDNIEFGLGVNLMLLDGLFFLGTGYNLSVETDELYYFLGTDLFKLLGSLKNSAEVGK